MFFVQTGLSEGESREVIIMIKLRLTDNNKASVAVLKEIKKHNLIYLTTTDIDSFETDTQLSLPGGFLLDTGI